VVEVLTSLLRTYEAPAEGAPATSPSRRASCDLPVHPRTLQQVPILSLVLSPRPCCCAVQAQGVEPGRALWSGPDRPSL